NNYWATPFNYDITNTGLSIIDLENQSQYIGDSTDDYKEVDVSHIYIAGFWTIGGENHQVQINRVYATNVYPED
ncbi:MAG: hypothetical protein LUC22_06165, partial [Prevotella sp.]|nr:hypothetical protein [Prevotella sp.]